MNVNWSLHSFFSLPSYQLTSLQNDCGGTIKQEHDDGRVQPSNDVVEVSYSFVLKLWSLTAAFIVQYTLMSDSEGNSFVSRASWFKCTCLLHLTGCFRLFRFTVVTLVWQQIFYCFCYVQTLSKSIIFLLLEINLKFPAAGVHQPFIPMKDKIFLKQLPKHTNRGSLFHFLHLCPEF